MGRELIANSVTITIEPEGKTIAGIPWTSGMNVQQAMERAYSVPPGLEFALQYYGASLGYAVIMIDGTFNAGNEYWFLYVNGILSSTGIDETILNDGDVVGFVYEAYNESTHTHALHKAIHTVHQKLKARAKSF